MTITADHEELIPAGVRRVRLRGRVSRVYIRRFTEGFPGHSFWITEEGPSCTIDAHAMDLWYRAGQVALA